MLRDYLKVEKEDQLVEQQSRHDNSQHYSSVTEWVILRALLNKSNFC